MTPRWTRPSTCFPWLMARLIAIDTMLRPPVAVVTGLPDGEIPREIEGAKLLGFDGEGRPKYGRAPFIPWVRVETEKP